jgi:peptidyl-prolyl cis-trans isomerase C
VLRVFPLIAVLIIASCSRTPAQASAEAAPQAPATPPATAKPVPTQLPEILARVNGETVTKTEFERAVQNLEGRAGGPVPPDQRDRIFRGVLDQLIGYKLLAQETKSRNLQVPEAEIEARIAEIRKQFPSEDLFAQMLEQRKLTVDQIKADARQDMAVAKMIETEIAGKVEVKAEQVQDFYVKNPDQFKQQERVRASHILIAFPEGADAAAKAQARTKAEQVLADVKAGKDFAALAKQHSQDPGSAVNGGDLGFFQQGQMVGPFNDTAFSQTVGTTSDLVETQFGFHIIKVNEKQPSRVVPLDEVRPKVEEYLQNRNREQQTEAFVNSLKSKGMVEILI